MHPAFAAPGGGAAVPIWFVNGATWREVRAGLDRNACAFAEAAGFEPVAGRHAFLPGPDGTLAGVLFGQENDAVDQGWVPCRQARRCAAARRLPVCQCAP